MTDELMDYVLTACAIAGVTSVRCVLLERNRLIALCIKAPDRLREAEHVCASWIRLHIPASWRVTAVRDPGAMAVGLGAQPS